MTNQGKLLVGRIGKPHGIGGEVYVTPISDDPRRFESGSALEHEDGRRMVVEASRTHRDRLLVKFEGTETRSDAERLRGDLYVAAADRRSLEPGEYWEHDLIGCEVFLPDGERVGRIQSVQPGGAQDLLVIYTPAGERMMPFVNDFIVEIDLDSSRVVIAPPAGLLDA